MDARADIESGRSNDPAFNLLGVKPATAQHEQLRKSKPDGAAKHFTQAAPNVPLSTW